MGNGANFEKYNVPHTLQEHFPVLPESFKLPKYQFTHYSVACNLSCSLPTPKSKAAVHVHKPEHFHWLNESQSPQCVAFPSRRGHFLSVIPLPHRQGSYTPIGHCWSPMLLTSLLRGPIWFSHRNREPQERMISNISFHSPCGQWCSRDRVGPWHFAEFWMFQGGGRGVRKAQSWSSRNLKNWSISLFWWEI